MKITVFQFDGTTEELNGSPTLTALLERLSDRAVRVPDSGSDLDPDADDAEAEANAEASEAPAPSGPGTVPGVSADGQAAVREQLDRNPAADLFAQFMAETTLWDAVKVHGVRIRRSAAGAPLDYSRYLRLKMGGSKFGGFAYVAPSTGVIEPRLGSATDDELFALAPRARRHEAGHEAYRVVIEIVDQETLDQAIALARLAYDRT